MATTFIDLNGDGNNNKNFSFASYQVGDIVVEVDNVIKTVTTHYNVTNYTTSGGGTIVFTSGNIPASGSTIRISRDTDVDSAKATYQAGSSVKAGDLNNNQTQVLYALQEEQNQTITTSRIKDGAVTRVKIEADAIDGTKIADDAINSEHYAAGSIDLEHMSANSVDSNQYVDASIDSEHIANKAVTATQIADNTITGGQLANDCINSEHYVDGSIDLAHMSANSVDSDQYVDGSVDLIHLSANSVDSSKIVDGSIVNADINASAGISISKLDGVTSTNTELNILDGVTATTAELNYVDGVTSNVQTQLDAKQTSDAELTELATMASGTASALADLTQAEVQILDGATVTTTELNKLDGVTASATNLNIVDGMTKQTTISDQDTSYPTSGAVVDYVAAQIAPIGGLEVIANKDSFPETQPASGVVISIADAVGIVVNGSGTSTTPDTISSDATVTINNINSAFHSATVASGVGWLVTSTGSGQIYNYHKANIKESDVVQLSDDINDFNSRYRIAGSAPGSNNDEGDLYFDTGSNKMYVYDGSSWGEVTSTGDFKYLVPCAFNTGTGNAAVFNGSISKYDLRENSTSGSLASVTNAAQLMVSVNGVVQKPNTGTSIGSNDGFCMVDGHTIEFGANLPTGSEVFVVQSGSALAINVVGDGTVTEAKLNANAPTNDYVLTADSTAAGGFKWAAAAASTITTQGDILYRGASGNERLAAGTSGYYLKTQGSGANPVWAAVSQYSTPLTTRGDILFRDASGDQRLAKGTAGQYLKIGANDPEWADVVGAVADGCIFENDQTISNNYTIASGKGAHSVGPITVNATVTVNGNWVVS